MYINSENYNRLVEEENNNEILYEIWATDKLCGSIHICDKCNIKIENNAECLVAICPKCLRDKCWVCGL